MKRLLISSFLLIASASQTAWAGQHSGIGTAPTSEPAPSTAEEYLRWIQEQIAILVLGGDSNTSQPQSGNGGQR